MKTIKIFPIICVVLMFCSCQEVLDFDPGEINPYPVMISKPDSEDSVVTVYVSQSRFFLDENNYPGGINGATVVLEVNGTPLTGTFDNDPSNRTYDRYVFNVHPQPGDSLHLTASVPGFDKTMSAGTRVPVKPQVVITDFVIDTTDCYFREWDSTWVRQNYYFRIKFKLTSTSPKEFYAVRAIISQGVDYNDTTYSHWDTNEVDFLYEYFECNDPIVNTTEMEDLLEGEASTSFYGDKMVFSNELFQSGEHEFTIEFGRWADESHSGHWGNYMLDYSQIPIRLLVRSLSRDLYLYTLTTQQQSDMDIFFSEPVQVHCNINDGIGIFGASSLNKLHLPAPRFEDFNHNENDYYYEKK